MDNDPNLEGISRIIDDTKQGRIRETFKAAEALGGLGAAYLTKLLYFVGRDAPKDPILLILDKNVAEALRRLSNISQESEEEGWSDSCLVQLGLNDNPELDYRSYDNYINCMHDWANQLKCPRADYLEYFLYKKYETIPDVRPRKRN